MANKTFEEALQQTRDNLTAMGQLAVSDSVHTLPYVEVEGNTYPAVDFVVNGVSYQRQDQGQQIFTVNLRMRIKVDQILAGFEGNRQQAADFHYLPNALQYFAQHPKLAYPGSPKVPFIDGENTSIPNSQVGIDNGLIVITLNWNIVYRTSFEQLC